MRYEKLFSVNFSHKYYQSGSFNGFRIVPEGLTTHYMKSFGLLIKEVGDGFLVLFKEEKEGGSLLRKLAEPLKLSFTLFCEDKQFLNYSDVFLNDLNKGFLLHNFDKKGGENVFLHENDHLAAADQVHWVSSLQDIGLRHREEPGEIKIEDIAGEEIYNGSWRDLKSGMPWEQLQEIGYLKTHYNNSDTPEHLYCVAPSFRKAFGVINIYVGGEEGNFDHIMNSSYKVAIDSKAVIWKYNLINRDKQKYSNFKILEGKEVVPTSEAIETTLINGEKAYQLECLQPLQLRERYERHLELEMIKTDAKAVDQKIKKRIKLPVPDVKRIKVARSGDTDRAYSEMYIYF